MATEPVGVVLRTEVFSFHIFSPFPPVNKVAFKSIDCLQPAPGGNPCCFSRSPVVRERCCWSSVTTREGY